METSEVVKELNVLLNKYPNWNEQEIERVRILCSKLLGQCADVLWEIQYSG